MLLAAGLLVLAGCIAALFDDVPDNIDLLIAGGIAAASLLSSPPNSRLSQLRPYCPTPSKSGASSTQHGLSITIINDPMHCRLAAERARQLASDERNSELRSQWAQLADAYERMARVADAAGRADL
jgi:hypothetical protein